MYRDRQTDRWTDKATFRSACTRMKSCIGEVKEEEKASRERMRKRGKRKKKRKKKKEKTGRNERR